VICDFESSGKEETQETKFPLSFQRDLVSERDMEW
jgi:hypothetical protein